MNEKRRSETLLNALFTYGIPLLITCGLFILVVAALEMWAQHGPATGTLIAVVGTVGGVLLGFLLVKLIQRMAPKN